MTKCLTLKNEQTTLHWGKDSFMMPQKTRKRSIKLLVCIMSILKSACDSHAKPCGWDGMPKIDKSAIQVDSAFISIASLPRTDKDVIISF